MQEVISLQSRPREVVGRAVKNLRDKKVIPAVLYGHNVKPVNLEIDYAAFEKALSQAGESTLVDLTVGQEKSVKVLIQDFQVEPRTGMYIHVDFHQVRMDEKLRTKIALKFIGEAPIVKAESATLVTNIDEIEVECLPSALVHEIEVDVSGLKTFEDQIHIADLKIPAGIKVLIPETEVVVLAQPPRSDKELADLESKPEAPVTEVIADKPAEGAETDEK